MRNFRLLQTETDNNFKFDEYGRKLSKQVENTVGKGEIARYECGCKGTNRIMTKSIGTKITTAFQPSPSIVNP